MSLTLLVAGACLQAAGFVLGLLDLRSRRSQVADYESRSQDADVRPISHAATTSIAHPVIGSMTTEERVGLAA